MGLYFLETVIILLAAGMHRVNLVILFFVLISFTANATHSIMGPAAAMDIGGALMWIIRPRPNLKKPVAH